MQLKKPKQKKAKDALSCSSDHVINRQPDISDKTGSVSQSSGFFGSINHPAHQAVIAGSHV